jgi:N6-L-threonylcarbamoyladenine synthase
MPPLNPPKPSASIILGIESSCDDTAASILCDGKILANVAASQSVHEQYGGVVPELASRAHQSNIIPVINEALKQANCDISSISAVAVTQGPGLMGSLLVGNNVAKGFCIARNLPLIGVNHLQAHVAALFIDHDVKLPMLCLLVSGGHTQLIWVESIDKMDIIGSTQDDAAGEAFDKAAKLMGLGYPGGPMVDRLAQGGNPKTYAFPDAQTDGYNFSFSGIKTSLLYFLRDQQKADEGFIGRELANVCASYQHQIVESLMKRLRKAILEKKPASIGLSGGVSANSALRIAFQNMGQSQELSCYIPAFAYCTDNAAMVAMAGYHQYLKGKFTPLDAIPYARAKQ